MHGSPMKTFRKDGPLSALGALAANFLVLATIVGGVELCVVLSVYDFPVFGAGSLILALLSSILEYFLVLMLLGAGLLALGTLFRPLAFLRGFGAQLGVVLAALFFFCTNFYLQQYVLPKEDLLALPSLLTMLLTLLLAIVLAVLTARLAARVRVRRGVLLPLSLAVVLAAVVLQSRLEEAAIGARRAGDPTSPNILFITIDTLRADRLAVYGYDKVQTPTIDALAASGVRFDTCLTSIPLTLPSHSAIFTGRYPPALTTRVNGDVLPESETTLAELLQKEGYRTAAVIGAVVLDSRSGIDQGFDDYYDRMNPSHAYLLRVILSRVELLIRGSLMNTRFDIGGAVSMTQKTADQVTDEALAWLERRPPGPWLFWVHYFDPHAPYTPPEPYSSRHETSYDGEVAFVDAELGRLLEGVDRTVGRENLLIVLTADHGEGLREHGYNHHRQKIYEEQLRVPLILAGFGPFERPAEIEGPVRTIDITPSLIEILDLGKPVDLHGESALGFLRGEASDRSTYIETLDAGKPSLQLFGLREGRWKLIRTLDGSGRELFDLERDPEELDNLWPREKVLGREMENRLRDLMQALDLSILTERSQVDPWHREMLKSLGYVN